MENNYNNKDFEHFLKQSADQYRMFPSEKVWNNIHNTLHTRRRWYGIGLTLLLLTTGIVTWVMLLSPAGNKLSLINNDIVTEAKKLAAQKVKDPDPVILITPVRTGNHVSSPSDKLISSLYIIPENTSNSNMSDETVILEATIEPEVKPVAVPVITISEADLSSTQKNIDIHRNISSKPAAHIVPAVAVVTTTPVQTTEKINPESASPTNEAPTEKNDVALSQKDNYYPLTIESVVNSFQRISNRRRVSWQIYFLPTVSYRKLAENKALLDNSQLAISSSPLNYVVAHDVNTAVTHKPDIGFELGFNAGFPIARNVKLTAGLQMNVSKYDIKAYPFPVVEQARIVLNNNNGSTSISNVETNYRNYESFTKPDWLSNFYISASLPVGLEVNLTDTRKTYLGMGGTVQPTYILGDRAYLISTDFKNYAKMPSLTRGWNVSTSLEVFAGYTTGRIKWKVGPQVRYQMLSSFAKKYPVKEHLIDFGLKVGVMLR